MIATVQIRRAALAQLCEEAVKTPTHECCGLLAGREGIINVLFAARNAHANPATAYEIAPQELFQIMQEIRARHLQLLGIYHSHPRGENRPSPRDIEQAFYLDTPYFILSPSRDTDPVRAFLIRAGEVAEVRIEIAP